MKIELILSIRDSPFLAQHDQIFIETESHKLVSSPDQASFYLDQSGHFEQKLSNHR